MLFCDDNRDSLDSGIFLEDEPLYKAIDSNNENLFEWIENVYESSLTYRINNSSFGKSIFKKCYQVKKEHNKRILKLVRKFRKKIKHSRKKYLEKKEKVSKKEWLKKDKSFFCDFALRFLLFFLFFYFYIYSNKNFI